MTAQSEAAAPDPGPAPTVRGTLRLALVVGALGVVFGDIGTSPIYALQTLFNPADPHPVPIDDNNVYGLVSVIFWSLMIVVTIFYVSLAMRADNDGEGGIMALITLLRRHRTGRSRRTTLLLAAFGIFGAALFLGDSMITPAISVLSAVEGLKVIDPRFDVWVIPITAVIIVLLFGFQRKGTATIGRLFGPVMIAWFLTLAVLGIGGISTHPEILRALSPTYAVAFLFGHFHIAFFALAAVVLTFTGAEALYADMGHFGRRNITTGWILLVFPALLLNYMGQGAMILQSPANVSGPFFLLAPEWGRIPLTVLATAATVIASQAVITGAYSVASQASKLGYLPRLRISHTSEHEIGQIYVPWINWMLMVSVLTLVFAFRSSASLAYAYGMAVIGTITIVTVLYCYVARRLWNAPRWLVLTGGGLLLAFDLLFLAANTTKLVHGAWLPLVIGITAFTVMVTWQRGREIVTAERLRREGPLDEFLSRLQQGEPKVAQVPGTAVFLNRGTITAPLAMRANMERNHVRHAKIVVMSVETEPVPRVPDAERVIVRCLGAADEGIVHVTARFGYMEPQDVPAALRLAKEQTAGRGLKLRDTTYFLSTIQLRGGPEPTMASWRKRLFIATAHITADAADHFKLPRDRTVIIGSQIEV
ncbi:potassium transporter Kup [Glycomyces algeriensis]|uniref:Probable potassium transport system protein Kup n=1 Tax=Glycomyces algeriensis TaxID=256037 RepID=A0A9W6GCW8_9ACTN|nr:KUP/HAK/KT family potassium transporter [Glycomyces algeriensis]MDA1368222.1 KUP/HAK/KT family potassium transporter [Glycomyces algeriensis]MDR7351862.1 KUP system potassium uptake protein [Glycomyces algeriensis]GLI44591.1 putative potassium transport system protein kup [Glycomyces algeriensis]